MNGENLKVQTERFIANTTENVLQFQQNDIIAKSKQIAELCKKNSQTGLKNREINEVVDDSYA